MHLSIVLAKFAKLVLLLCCLSVHRRLSSYFMATLDAEKGDHGGESNQSRAHPQCGAVRSHLLPIIVVRLVVTADGT